MFWRGHKRILLQLYVDFGRRGEAVVAYSIFAGLRIRVPTWSRSPWCVCTAGGGGAEGPGGAGRAASRSAAEPLPQGDSHW